MCVGACMYVCVHVHVCVCLYVYAHMSVYECLYMCMFGCVCICAYVQVVPINYILSRRAGAESTVRHRVKPGDHHHCFSAAAHIWPLTLSNDMN